MENTQLTAQTPASVAGLPTVMQQALYAQILPKLETCKRYLHYTLTLEDDGRRQEAAEALATMSEFEKGYRAGSESDLHKLVAIVTLMEPDLAKMEQAIKGQIKPASQTRLIIRRTTTYSSIGYQRPKKSLVDSFIDWLL
jgi:hypothetical protein